MVKYPGSSKSWRPLPEGLEKRTVTKMQERAVVMIQALMDRGWALSKPQAGGRGWR